MSSIGLDIDPTKKGWALEERPDVLVPFDFTNIIVGTFYLSPGLLINILHDVVERRGRIDANRKVWGSSNNSSGGLSLNPAGELL